MIAKKPHNASPVLLGQLGVTSASIGIDHGPEERGGNQSTGRGVHAKSYDTLGTIPRVRADTATAKSGVDKARYIATSTAEVNEKTRGVGIANIKKGIHTYMPNLAYYHVCYGYNLNVNIIFQCSNS